MTEQLARATRREMRQLVDECLSEFSDRVENKFVNFENRLGANESTHFLGRKLESTGFNQTIIIVRIVVRHFVQQRPGTPSQATCQT
jgi:S-adenosylmethionine:diacylglycerol 3-amino-3-carboxypropyl transferase